jgi:hypothetical protein
MFRSIMAACTIASLAGCAAPTTPACAPGYGQPVAIVTLYFGKAIPGRSDLTDQEWQGFLGSAIAANLPDGYTVWDANGGWLNPITDKTVREGSKVLLVALPEAPDSLAAIGRIRSAYQTQYQQQSVGMTVEHGCGAF